MTDSIDLLGTGVSERALEALAEIQRFQQVFDDVNWTSSLEPLAKRRHIGFHLTIAAGKLARIEERQDHGVEADGVVLDVAADLLVYALQIASLSGEGLGALYRRRISALLANEVKHETFLQGTPTDSRTT